MSHSATSLRIGGDGDKWCRHSANLHLWVVALPNSPSKICLHPEPSKALFFSQTRRPLSRAEDFNPPKNVTVFRSPPLHYLTGVLLKQR